MENRIKSRTKSGVDVIQNQINRQRCLEIRGESRQQIHTRKDIDKFVDNQLSDVEIDSNYSIRKGILDVEMKELDTVRKILTIAREIQHHDCSFENLNSEKERAELIATDMIEGYEKIKVLLPMVKEEFAEIVIEGLRVMNYPYVRVLGDRLSYRKDIVTGKDYETLIKNLYNSEILKIKAKRYHLKKYLTSQQISKTTDLKELFKGHNLY